MVGGKTIRLSKLAREFNVGIHTIVEFLHKKGFDIDSNPNTKVSEEAVQLLEKEYKIDISLKKESEKISLKSNRPKKEVISMDDSDVPEEKVVQEKVEEKKKEEVKEVPEVKKEKKEIVQEIKTEKAEKPLEEKPAKPEEKIKVVGKIDLDNLLKPKPVAKKEEEKKADIEKPAPKKEVERELQKEEVKAAKEEKEKQEEKSATEKKEEPKKEVKQEERPVELMETKIPKVEEVKVVGKIDLKNINQKTRPAKKTREEKEKERKERLKQREAARHPKQIQETKAEAPRPEVIKANANKLNGPTVVGKIDLPERNQQGSQDHGSSKKRRKRIAKDTGKVSFDNKQGGERSKPNFQVNKQGSKKKRPLKKEVNEEDVQKQIKDTLARLTAKGKSKGSKHRRDKRAAYTIDCG
jgi:translation initiation factor IF-2